ncbi:DUF2309 domain-containing protein [Rummeliibacillus pycnus]|uniref:DUF2309 domain-containing protein n=1 Tax=Rummeliibacillus pycnus TaxID=101070 RepID=UPI000C9AD1CC|nr:putative inorganic carbon transporter subunit DabA [Rummeliibacillus pycnus]
MSTAVTLNFEKESDYLNFDINDLVKSASEVIVPLGHINSFAARSPWAGLEHQTFEQVARRLKDTCDVDIYPNHALLKSAFEKGEINKRFLEEGMKKWLEIQDLDIPRSVAEQYCRNALEMNQKPYHTSVGPEVEQIAKKMSHFKNQIPKNYTVLTYSQRIEKTGKESIAEDLNLHIIKWCKLYLDESQAVWSMPNREEGFYRAWKAMIQYDPALNHGIRKQLKTLSEDAEQVLTEVLINLGIPQAQLQDYLEAHLLALPGWAGMMLWRSQQSSQEEKLLLDYLAIRIAMEWAMVETHLPLPTSKVEDQVLIEPLLLSWAQWGDMPIGEWTKLTSTKAIARLLLADRFDQFVRNHLWLEAWEKTYEVQLKEMILSKQPKAAQQTKNVMAQFAFCIDVRSEPFRRQLEKVGPFETFGTAGFFGLPIETTELGSAHSHESLPVMFKPQYKVIESSTDVDLKHYKQRTNAANSISHTFKTMKHNMLSNLLLPEISGPWLSLQTLARSFVPQKAGYAMRKIREKWLYKPSTKLSLEHMHTLDSELQVGFSEKEQVLYARQALNMMGLTNHFAPLVVICGHGSHSTNNPYSSALDCGACGGASSKFNARVLATLCNLPKVRAALETEGIVIPEETVFVAAEHITTLDELHFVYVPQLSKTAKESYDCIQKKLPKVREEANAERIEQLPTLDSHYKNLKEEVQRFAEDWSEVRPEWGLARNATFIIGERKLTEACNLEGRAFLHNYQWKNDVNGDILAKIIAGPAKVAQWINLQYYASTVAPHYYGSGNKTTQTITSGIGVMQGNASDLMSGLPWQSVMLSDEEAYHEPLRLLIVIQAPKKHIERLLERDQAFLQKLQHGWIRLASIDSEGHWESWS